MGQKRVVSFRSVLKPSKEGLQVLPTLLLASVGHLLVKAGTCLCALAEFVCFQFSNQLSRGGNGVPRCQPAAVFIGKVSPLRKVCSGVWRGWMSQPCAIPWDVADVLHAVDVPLRLLRVVPP